MDSTTEESSTKVRFNLWSALIVGAALLSVTLLVSFTGDANTFWPLYIIPIILGAVLFNIVGALLTAAGCIAAVGMVSPAGTFAGTTGAQLALGLGAFAVSGIFVGFRTARSIKHEHALEKASYRDEQTGLYKPEYFRQRLIEEIRRATRHDVEVGLLVVRVDGLAAFRNTFGAYKTGLLMEHLADILRITVRDTDIVGRYGSESFGVLLPFASPAEAMLVSDRVRSAACEAEFEGDVLQPSTHCPVSVASVSFPAEASSLESVVALVADRLVDTAPDHEFSTRKPGLRLGEAHS